MNEFQSFHMVTIPIWIALPVLALVLVGGWKLAKLLWAARSNWPLPESQLTRLEVTPIRGPSLSFRTTPRFR